MGACTSQIFNGYLLSSDFRDDGADVLTAKRTDVAHKGRRSHPQQDIIDKRHKKCDI